MELSHKKFKPMALVVLPGLLLTLLGAATVRSTPPVEQDRSPSDLALSSDGHFALTANSTANTVSLVDLTAGKVLAETPVGKRPFCVALSKDGTRAVVSNWLSNTITVLDVQPQALQVVGTIPVGDEPRGVILSADGAKAYVVLAGEDSLASVDLKTMKVTARLEVGIEPWHVALTPDGKRLAVGNARSQDVSVIDIAGWKIDHSVKLRGKNVRHIACSPDGDWAYVLHDAERGRPATKEDIDLGWIVGSRLSRAPLKEEGPREAIALDPRGKAVGDVDGVAVSPDGNTIAVTAGGTHELLLFRQPLPFVAYGGPADHMEKEIVNDPVRFKRIPLGGRPLGVTFDKTGKILVVANYLSNAVQVVDVESAQVTKTIPLGGSAVPSLARRGEVIFHDAERSFNHWYSCNSCHTEGHTNGSTFDTFNDGSYGTPKKTLSLRGVSQTGPWTWHGWQKSLKQLVHDSMTKSMQGPEPTDEDMEAVMAYLGTLDFRPNPHRTPDGSLTPAAKRGEAVFNAKNCQSCHASPNYTTPAVYMVGLESEQDVYKGFNPPTLRGVYNRGPFLHTGDARSLEEVLTKYHQPSKLTGKPDCTPQELGDLIAFLSSL
jgi:YVTN family beta-propeller protein